MSLFEKRGLLICIRGHKNKEGCKGEAVSEERVEIEVTEFKLCVKQTDLSLERLESEVYIS